MSHAKNTPQGEKPFTKKQKTEPPSPNSKGKKARKRQ